MTEINPVSSSQTIFGQTPRQAATEALARLAGAIEKPGALTFSVANRASLARAMDRVAAQLLREDDLTLTIALAGGSGAGKSTLINALAGGVIAEAAAQRPCTMQATVYHHRNATSAGLPPELVSLVRTVSHNRPELRFKVLIDTPDLDTFATQNRTATRALLKAAGLVIYVFTPEKYWDERVWSVIREEQRFSASLVVLNKSDTVPAIALERAAEEIKSRFAQLGHPGLPLLRVSALRHIARADGSLPTGSTDPSRATDEFPSLRAYIEYELREGDIARIRTQQRLGVVANLEQELAQLVPADLPVRIERLTALAETLVDQSTSLLGHTLADKMALMEADLRPLAYQRRNQRFFGPFRTWLSTGSLVSEGVPRLARRLRLLGGSSPENDPGPLAFHKAEIADQLRTDAARLRDAAFAESLPVERWRFLASQTETAADTLVRQLTDEVQGRFMSAELKGGKRLKAVAWLASLTGSVIPVVLATYALWALLVRLGRGELPSGLGMLGLVVALTLLAFVVLQALTSVALAGTGPPAVASVGPQALRAVLRRTLGAWILSYRQAIETDLEAIREPVEALRAVAEAPLESRSVAEPLVEHSSSNFRARPESGHSLPRPELLEPEVWVDQVVSEEREAETTTVTRVEPTVEAVTPSSIERDQFEHALTEGQITEEPVVSAPLDVAPSPLAGPAPDPRVEEPLPSVTTARPADLFRQAFERRTKRTSDRD